MKEQPFYVGYMPQMEGQLARFIGRWVVALLVLGIGLGFWLASSQTRLTGGFFDFGHAQSFEGILQLEPQPMLWVQNPNSETRTAYLLVAPFKFGAGPLIQPFDNQNVVLQGSLIHRHGRVMLELVPDSIEPRGGEQRFAPQQRVLGQVELAGEIVDAKCYLGVMNPGHLKPHRDCAVRCISGGIPPVFLVRNEEGLADVLLLVNQQMKPFGPEILEWVARPMRIKGQLVQSGNLWLLKTEAVDFHALD
ncbi:MAG: hypothetical protein H6510_12435 [Acidobacteria bacterium]|nr:hypothetical protein [Acidobacteriota bacterium]MCB9398613.1 hypothetical protein [Acidobacteriota bacterium]